MRRSGLAARGLGGRFIGGLIVLCVASVLSISQPSLAYAAQDLGWEGVFQAGIAARNRGNIQLSIDLLSKARGTAASAQARTRASAELGASLLQAQCQQNSEQAKDPGGSVRDDLVQHGFLQKVGVAGLRWA